MNFYDESSLLIRLIIRFMENFLWFDKLTINGFGLTVILWNLILAFMPLIIILYLRKYWRQTNFSKFYQKIISFLLGFIWLLFIPNSAYLIMDVRNLMDYCPLNSSERVCPEHAWMILFFFSYAAIGWVTFYHLVRLMRDFLEEIFNRFTAKAFIICLIPLMSLGILLGLLDRWNSWDIFLFPKNVLNDIISYITTWQRFFDWLLFSLFFYILYLAGGLLFKFPAKGK